MEKMHELDEHHRARFVKAGGQVIGLVLFHDRAVSNEQDNYEDWVECDPGFVQWEPHGESKPLYTLVTSDTTDEISVRPHIICRTCFDAGYITNGKWIRYQFSPQEDALTMDSWLGEQIEAEDQFQLEDGTVVVIQDVSTRYDIPPSTTDDNLESLRKSLLDEVASLVLGDRNAAYGPPHQDFARTAAMLTEMWRHKLRDKELIHAHDVAELMIVLKLSRLQWSPGKRDSWVDIAGYAACGYEAHELTKDEQ
jgi:hypothetical protein